MGPESSFLRNRNEKQFTYTYFSSITIYNILVDIVTVVGNVIKIDYAQ